VTSPFRPRPVRFHGLLTLRGTTCKLYSITHHGGQPGWERFVAGLSEAASALPEGPDAKAGRPGLGVVIVHAGAGVDYVVLMWWDRGNELPIRVFVCEPGQAWRHARGGESVCVWDLDVIWFERQAWVETMMAAAGPSAPAYLARTTGETAPPPAIDLSPWKPAA